MSFEEDIKEFREREKAGMSLIGFINMAREIDRKDRTMDVCPYMFLCPNTTEAIEYGFGNTSLGMNPSIDCVGGAASHNQCPIYAYYDGKFLDILSLIQGDRAIRSAFYMPLKEGRE